MPTADESSEMTSPPPAPAPAQPTKSSSTASSASSSSSSSSAAAAVVASHVVDADDRLHYVVHTTYGPIRGEQRISYLGNPFYSFRSVPYAKPPVGELRFRDPQPPDVWVTPLDATVECCSAPFADETETAVFRTSEDCLLLNVYTNELPDGSDGQTKTTKTPATGRPVMVWLHGGAFRVGSSSEHMYGPDFLLSADIVLVTVNYRLGALGFLSIDDPAVRVPGNAGLKDQTLALRWVRDNIGRFGGDPQNVTLFGNSAGACAVHLHMLSAHSADLFHKAIVQSGTALAEWANFPKNRWTRRLADALGWRGGDNDAEMYAFLCAASAEEIVAQQDAILTRDEQLSGIFSFGPACEAYESEQCFFVEDPQQLVERPLWSSRVALMIGSTADEGLLLYRAIKKRTEFFQSAEGFEMLVPSRFGHVRGSERSVAIARQIRDWYYTDGEPTVDNFQKTLQIWGDRAFWHSVHCSIMARKVSDGLAPTYLYRYAGESGRFNWKKLQFCGEDVRGASHADEVHFLFKCAYLTEQLPRNCRELKTMREMVGMWTRFAASGNPNCPEMGDVVWDRIQFDAGKPFKCLNIGETLSFIDLPETERIAFWEKLYAENIAEQ